MQYDRESAINYARKWALARNPRYGNFNGIGGDCTNFISQCVYAGCNVMNYKRDVGWYYISMNNRAAAWTGVQFFYNFMTTNKGVGPYASVVSVNDILPGDIIQLGDATNHFYHTL